MTKLATVSAQAQNLSPLERVELVETILQSLDPIAPEAERRWAAEAKDRWAAHERGELKARDLDEALSKYDAL